MPTTPRRSAGINLALRGIDADFCSERADTFRRALVSASSTHNTNPFHAR
jgi:hypothetical protein